MSYCFRFFVNRPAILALASDNNHSHPLIQHNKRFFLTLFAIAIGLTVLTQHLISIDLKGLLLIVDLAIKMNYIEGTKGQKMVQKSDSASDNNHYRKPLQ